MLSLHEASQSDIETIMNIEKQSFESSVIEDKKVFLERMSVFPEGFLLLMVRDKIAGYFCSEMWREGKFPYSSDMFALGHSAKKIHCAEGNVLYIASMGVLPEFRGNGTGSFLFKESLKRINANIQTIEKELLLVNETWIPARSIYKKAGFAEVQTLKNFFELSINSFQNGIIMQRIVK